MALEFMQSWAPEVTPNTSQEETAEQLEARIAVLEAVNELFEGIDGKTGYSARGNLDRLKLKTDQEEVGPLWVARDLETGSVTVTYERKSPIPEDSNLVEFGERKKIQVSGSDLTVVTKPYRIYDEEEMITENNPYGFVKNIRSRSTKNYSNEEFIVSDPSAAVLEVIALLRNSHTTDITGSYRRIASQLRSTDSGGPSPSDWYEYYEWEQIDHYHRVTLLERIVDFVENDGLLPEKFDDSIDSLVGKIRDKEIDNDISRRRYRQKKAAGEPTSWTKTPDGADYQDYSHMLIRRYRAATLR